MKKAALLVGLALLFALGCGPSKQEVLNSWVGDHESNIIASWGPPSRTTPDGRGGHVLVWDDSRTAGVALPSYNSAVIVPVHHQSYRAAWVNDQGVIYQLKWQ